MSFNRDIHIKYKHELLINKISSAEGKSGMEQACQTRQKEEMRAHFCNFKRFFKCSFVYGRPVYYMVIKK